MDRDSVDWKGYIPAITTPFTEDGAFDVAALGQLLEWLQGEGMHGLVIAGTTGEWFSLEPTDRLALFRATGAQLRGKLPLIGGCNAFTPAQAIANAQLAAESGFDGILLTPPPYMVPNEDEIVAFYQTVSDHSSLPICVYNWPPGTNVDMSLPLLTRLAAIDKVVAIKNSTARLDHFIKVFLALKDQVRIFGFGLDELCITLMQAHGGEGTMGAGAVLGRTQPDFYNHLWQGDLDAARRCGKLDQRLMQDWFTPSLTGKFGSAQATLKTALNLQGLPGGYPRPPLLPLTALQQEQVRATLVAVGRL